MNPLISLLFLFLNSPSRLAAPNVIKVAHLQPNDPSIMHEPHVLKMCAVDLKERGILPSEITLQ
jgi:hypothetical protein